MPFAAFLLACLYLAVTGQPADAQCIDDGPPPTFLWVQARPGEFSIDGTVADPSGSRIPLFGSGKTLWRTHDGRVLATGEYVRVGRLVRWTFTHRRSGSGGRPARREKVTVVLSPEALTTELEPEPVPILRSAQSPRILTRVEGPGPDSKEFVAFDFEGRSLFREFLPLCADPSWSNRVADGGVVPVELHAIARRVALSPAAKQCADTRLVQALAEVPPKTLACADWQALLARSPWHASNLAVVDRLTRTCAAAGR